MAKKDWDCKRDGHIPASKTVKNYGLGKGTRKVTWCMMCGKKL